MKQALMVWGGWDGHQPKECVDRFAPFLKVQGFEVTIRDSLDAYLDKPLMDRLDLVVQSWTCGQLSGDQEKALIEAVKRGVGIAGWHGGLGDSFRNSVDYQFMIGGQWVQHPGNLMDYEVHISDFDDPVTAGLKDFRMTATEQYYLHVDPSNIVLANTTFSGDTNDWIKGTVMPVVWKRRCGKGRVFYNSLGHNAKDFDVPEARTIMERGMIWAARN
ncbi:MAG: ThuA domain-containing protein [Planctomycetes bacterium]|nr:ThuA domain-containing protein [Planctomycetota bacterium]